MSLLWATRGRSWGFRFLRTAGLPDPLPAYEEAFAGAGDEPQAFHRTGGRVALRLSDPEGRRDRSGRVIVHEFVLVGEQARGVDSVADGIEHVWPQVAAEYAALYDAEDPPGGGRR